MGPADRPIATLVLALELVTQLETEVRQAIILKHRVAIKIRAMPWLVRSADGSVARAIGSV